jgi:hypothetical protein
VVASSLPYWLKDMIIIRFSEIWMGGKFTLFKRENPFAVGVFSGVKLLTNVDRMDGK